MLVLFGVVPVVVAFFVALSFLGQQEAPPPPEDPEIVVEKEAPPPPPEPEYRVVLSAARDLPVGTLIGRGDLRRLDLDISVAPGEFIALEEDASLRDYYGFAAREAVPAGTPIARAALIGPHQNGFLATVLRPGTRAVTIRVGQATSRAGLVDPGDRVDVILSAELRVGEQSPEVFARTIVEDVRVVGVDNRVAGAAPGDPTITTVTLEVSPPDGDRLVLAGHEGQLSISVRALVPADQHAPSEAVAMREVLLGARTGGALEELESRLRGEIMDVEERLLMEMEESAEPPVDTVRIYRGGESVEEVVFTRTPSGEDW